MRVTQAMPKTVSTTLNVIGATLLLIAAIPLFGALVVIARPLGVLLILVAIPLLVMHLRRKEAREEATLEEHHGVRVPPRRWLTTGHAWLTSGSHRGHLVGADDLLLRALGPVEQVSLPEPGTRVGAGQVLFGLRHGDREITVRAPFAAEVVSRNEALLTQPSLLDASPYDLGWVVRVRPNTHLEDAPLREAEEGTSWFRREVDRLLARIAPSPVPAMPDGGLISPDFHELIDAPTWRTVVEEFFS